MPTKRRHRPSMKMADERAARSRAGRASMATPCGGIVDVRSSGPNLLVAAAPRRCRYDDPAPIAEADRPRVEGHLSASSSPPVRRSRAPRRTAGRGRAERASSLDRGSLGALLLSGLRSGWVHGSRRRGKPSGRRIAGRRIAGHPRPSPGGHRPPSRDRDPPPSAASPSTPKRTHARPVRSTSPPRHVDANGHLHTTITRHPRPRRRHGRVGALPLSGQGHGRWWPRADAASLRRRGASRG
jgi:hypothetical protein